MSHGGGSDGGIHIKDWQNYAYLGEVTPETNAWHAVVPSSLACRFFLVDSSVGTPLKWVTSCGDAYVDTGFTVKSGDRLALRFRPEAYSQMGVLGTRKAVDDGNVSVTYSYSLMSLHYCNGNYETYRLQMPENSAPTNKWYDVVLSAAERSVRGESGELLGSNSAFCNQEFYTENNCWLFGTSGNPFVSTKLTGSVASFEVVRDGKYLASYQPFRLGGTCGFFDYATSNFVSAATGTFSGEDGDFALSPFAVASNLLTKEPGTEILQPREVSVVTYRRSGGEFLMQLVFGPDNGCANRLYVAYGNSKGGDRLAEWDNVQFLGVVYGSTSNWCAAIPSSADFCRFFLFLPFVGEDAPLPVQYVTGNRSGYLDTGLKLQGGDALALRFRPEKDEYMAILGTRKDVNTGNITITLTWDESLGLNYCNSDYQTYRLSTANDSTPINNWYDIVLSATNRSVRNASGALIGENNVLCTHQFETENNCWLFGASGNPSTATKLTGSIASFELIRDGKFVASYQPCRLGTTYGFYDMANGVFVAPASGTFTGGEEEEGPSPFVFMTKAMYTRGGFSIFVR